VSAPGHAPPWARHGVGSAQAAPHGTFDQLLDLHVRDGLVYYRALQADRAKLDRYISSLNVDALAYDRWDRNTRVAYWLNAYNAVVLRTVIGNYPIRGRSAAYPRNSIRQIPGAFERRTWRLAGKLVALDDIEKTHLASFKDPRVFFAIGRGTLGGGRLRSEAFDASRLDAQLTDVATDCVRRVTCAAIDQSTGTLAVSPIFSWREADFLATHDGNVPERYRGRSPMELAVVAFIEPHLYSSERSWLAENRFRMRYMEFDWRLNDLTGGSPG
jgi:hypothetical protein